MTQDEIEARGEFTPRTQGEIDRNLFAARTGALVTLSAGATWEILYPAQAWQRHVRAPGKSPREVALEKVLRGFLAPLPPIGDTNPRLWREGVEADMESLKEQARALLSSPLAPQARDTQGDEPCAT